MSSQPIPLDHSYVEYEIVEEHWNVYEFSDGLRVRVRIILTRLTRKRDKPGYDASFNLNVLTEAPPAQRGQPNPKPVEELEKLPSYEIKPITYTEPWNVYRVDATDEILKLKYVHTRFRRAKDQYDGFGEPQILVTGGPLFVVEPKTPGATRVTP